MKYTYDGSCYDWEPEFKKRNPNKVPVNKTVWGFAYHIDNETTVKHLFCKPEAGKVLEYEDIQLKQFKKLPRYGNSVFIPYKKDGKTFKESGIVNSRSRYYADTYEEAVEGYNSIIQDRINALEKEIEEALNDIIVK